MRLFVCVEHGSSALAETVKAASFLAFPDHKWVLPAGAATHAFLVMVHDGGWAYRLDAVFPRSVLQVDDGGLGTEREKRWELHVPPAHADKVRSAIAGHVGRWYDFAELPAQLLPGMQHMPGLPRAVICTHQVSDVMTAAGLDPHLHDWFPERLARFMDAAVQRGETWLLDK